MQCFIWEESWKYDAQRSIFDELWGVSSGDETLCQMLDITSQTNWFLKEKLRMQKWAVFHLISKHSLNILKFPSYFLYELIMSWENTFSLPLLLWYPIANSISFLHHQGDKLPGYPLVVRLFLSDDSDVAQTLLSRGLVKKSVLLNDEEPPQFYPQKRGPNKAKPVKSKRSITETRLVHAFKSSP